MLKKKKTTSHVLKLRTKLQRTTFNLLQHTVRLEVSGLPTSLYWSAVAMSPPVSVPLVSPYNTPVIIPKCLLHAGLRALLCLPSYLLLRRGP